MNYGQSLDRFITYLARNIATVYPSNCAGEEDYIQVGHLKLAEIHRDEQEKHINHLGAYAIIAIARAMRYAAIEAMYAVSASHRIKKQVHRIEMLLITGKTEQEICQELEITKNKLASLRSLINTESWHRLFEEPTQSLGSFFVPDDILSSDYLTEEDKIFIQAQLEDTIGDLGLSRKQQWLRTKSLRPKLIRSGYGI
jgi:DNA-directed RNA polymerase specialized sigma subunit